jgi:hypothetical protein
VKEDQPVRDRKEDGGCPGLGPAGRGMGRQCLMGTDFQVCKMESSEPDAGGSRL